MRLVIERRTALTEAELDSLGLVSGDVFGVAHLQLEWRRKRDHFLMRDGGQPVCRVGVVHHIQAAVGKKSVELAGIGGVVTVPGYQGQGCAARLLIHATTSLADAGYAYAALFCLDRLTPYYERLGWQRVAGVQVRFLQTAGYVESPLRFMTLALGNEAWPGGDVKIRERIW